MVNHPKIIRLAKGKHGKRLECDNWVCKKCNVVMDVSKEIRSKTWNFICPLCKCWFFRPLSVELKVQVKRFLLATIVLGNVDEKARAKTRLVQILGD